MAYWRVPKGIKFRTRSNLTRLCVSKSMQATNYQDVHLSHLEQQVRYGFFGDMDVALVEVTGILPDGRLIPSLAIGTNNQWLKSAKNHFGGQ